MAWAIAIIGVLIAAAQFVHDVSRMALRPGNVHSADGWRDVLEPVLARYRHKMKHRYFRGDAAFANPEVYELLEVEGCTRWPTTWPTSYAR